MNSIYRFFGYFIYVILVGIALVILIHFSRELLIQAKTTFNRMPHLYFITVYPVLLGILFSLPSLFRKISAQGKWGYDWIKALAVGIPTFLGSTLLFLTYSPYGNYLPKYLRMLASSEFTSLCGLALGYTITSCIKKKSVNTDESMISEPMMLLRYCAKS